MKVYEVKGRTQREEKELSRGRGFSNGLPLRGFMDSLL